VTFDPTLHTGHSVYNCPPNQEFPSSFVTQVSKLSSTKLLVTHSGRTDTGPRSSQTNVLKIDCMSNIILTSESVYPVWESNLSAKILYACLVPAEHTLLPDSSRFT
jgi:hypothetical protein